MLRRNVFFLLTALPLFGAALHAQKAPTWLHDKELEYPSRSYIAAVGLGGSKTAAEAQAVSQISMFFKTSTSIRNEVIRKFNEAAQNNTTDFSKKTYITENAVIQSEEELFAIRFAAPWEDAKRREWAALAYIDKNEAARIYEAKITAQMTAVNALLQDAKQEAEPLYTASLLNRAVQLCAVPEELIKSAAMVDPGADGKYRSYSAAIAELRSRYRAARSALSFNVTVNGPDTDGRIDRKLRQTLEDNGYTVSERGGAYALSARLSMREEESGSGVSFVTPGIVLRIERGGQVLFSYSKNYERASSRAGMNTARDRAVSEVEQDLEESFIVKFIAMLGT